MNGKRMSARRALSAMAVGAALLLSAPRASAKIDLVTLPVRDETQVTIYKAEDLTLVREMRTLTFDEGVNEIQFSWANTLIDPTSLQIRLVKPSPDFTVLDAHYPANTQNTIVWTIEAKKEGQAQVEISCFASGLSWQADYKVIANAEETELRLEPDFTIFNRSGEDFENARTRLVVGEINLVDAIAELARRGLIQRGEERTARREIAKSMVADELAMPAASSPFGGRLLGREEAKQIIKAAVSEYYLYSIEGTEDLEDGWGKQLPNPRVDNVPFEVSYEYDVQKTGDQVIKYYKLKNDEEHELGDVPMPAGRYYVYSDDGKGAHRFQASTEHKYAPVGEDIELNLGSDGLVLVEKRVMSTSRRNFDFDSNGDIRGWEEVVEQEIEIRNSKDRAVPFKMRDYFNGDWAFENARDEYKRVDQNTVEWEFEVPAQAKKVVTFTVVTKNGTLAKR
ncbi:MAG: hypothetical protein PWP23_1457 [Candidatus Sumerlaeota bacterium]|nr:hypothetical protein [Candidatus Sumerlaeota bacterium]